MAVPSPTQLECGCHWGIGSIGMCAMHEAAPDLLSALEPFALFNENGWDGTVWENSPENSPVLYRSKDGVWVTLGDFARAANAIAKARGTA